MNDKITKKILNKAYCCVRDCLNHIFFVFSISPQKIVFDNFNGRGYGDNPKYIAEEFIRRGAASDIVWLAKDTSGNFPKEIRAVKYGSIKAMYELATAKAWVMNVRNTIKPQKRRGQIYLQTWHASTGFKKMEGDAADSLKDKYIRHAKKDGANTDGILAASERQAVIFRLALWLSPNTEILKFGLPRDDYTLNNGANRKEISSIRREIGVGDDKFVVLYAPTYRESHSATAYLQNTESILEAFEKTMNRECVLLIRLHPNMVIAGRKGEFRFNHKIIDVCDYPDAQRISLASDCLITDYSSIIFDFDLLMKPIFLYASDYTEYKSSGRMNDLFDISPYEKAFTENELIEKIEGFDMKAYRGRVEDYYKKHPIFKTGQAAKLAADWIEEKIQGERA